MTIGELKEMIEHLEDNVEVRLMTQPSWPLMYSVSHGVTNQEMNDSVGCDDCGSMLSACDCEDKQADAVEEEIFYLTEGSQLGYGDKRYWDL